MSENAPKITIRLKKAGWEVEISCGEDQVKQAVDSVLASFESSSANAGQSPPRSSDNAAFCENKTCRGLVNELWAEGWFSQSRPLSDVHEEISRRGYHYDRTAVSHTLTDLVRENILTREGNPRSYTYIQKRPAVQGTIPSNTSNKLS